MTLWICGKYRGEAHGGAAWDFFGVFSSEEAALAACRAPEYFVAPVQLDEMVPQEPMDWPGCYFPRAA